ncbi:hypothetical protein Nepgr_018467 [Nepenthes gracilis]|uniref:TsaA-like domain-containing protein n=1 Tax=Nepenthes gracilis TaxID=150966 RepID=A0AAD3SV05_NEPGR|nr:hypothetical protein Nepgr_018467 [Nepenthes gracilis]
MDDSHGVYQWLTTAFTLAVATISVYILKKKWTDMESKVRGLERSLKSSLEKSTAERQGRIRAQQALRKALLQPKSDNLETICYPMSPIGIIHSCFSTRNGTPRQPLLVPLARACLAFDPKRVPPASLEGLENYSHCWIIYVFHLNTDLEKLWKEPSKSKFKAKVRVPRLKGGRMGVFATRSPHRPSPIGLTVAKVEAVQGHMVLLSGMDLVDGTPVLDIKPYIPYCDSIKEAAVPEWIMTDGLLVVNSVSFSKVFTSKLAECWELLERHTFYSSPDEIQRLIEQVLLWDIRSSSQRNNPHKSQFSLVNKHADYSTSMQIYQDEAASEHSSEQAAPTDIVYHLILEGLDISYEIDGNGCPTIVNQRGSVTSCGYILKDYIVRN